MGWLRTHLRMWLGIGQYGTPTVTKAGQKVKSRSEARIANYLYDNRIRYVYEPRLRVSLLSLKAIHPDFYLPDYDVYVEFWGLRGVENYNQIIRLKRQTYKRRHKRLIELSPSNLSNLEEGFPYLLSKATKR